MLLFSIYINIFHIPLSVSLTETSLVGLIVYVFIERYKTEQLSGSHLKPSLSYVGTSCFLPFKLTRAEGSGRAYRIGSRLLSSYGICCLTLALSEVISEAAWSIGPKVYL